MKKMKIIPVSSIFNENEVDEAGDGGFDEKFADEFTFFSVHEDENEEDEDYSGELDI